MESYPHKIIFLDVDGVINRISGENRTRFDFYQLEKDLVKHLEEIITETDASIIVSSTWRVRGMSKLYDCLEQLDFKYCDRIIGRTKNSTKSKERGVEILDKVKEMGITKWITIDDECIYMYQYLPIENIAKVDGSVGLTPELVQEAITKLNSGNSNV